MSKDAKLFKALPLMLIVKIHGYKQTVYLEFVL